MQVVVKDKKEIHLIEGRKVAGDVVELPEKVALRYLEQGAVERYETKVLRDAPFVTGGEAPLSASPAGQASPETTAKPSEGGGKRRGRKPSSR